MYAPGGALAAADDGGVGARVGGLVFGVLRRPEVHREVRPLRAAARQDRGRIRWA